MAPIVRLVRFRDPAGERSFASSFLTGLWEDAFLLLPTSLPTLGPIGHVEVKDVKSSLQGLIEAGEQLRQEVKDVGGKLIATVKDADGNVLGLMQSP